MRYFKKFGKATVWLQRGEWCKFEPVGDNWFVLATSDASTAQELDICMHQQRGGIENISQADYDALIKKKESLPTSPRPWREEWSNNSFHKAEGVAQLPVAAGVAAAEGLSSKIKPTPAPLALPEFDQIPRPTTVR